MREELTSVKPKLKTLKTLNKPTRIVLTIAIILWIIYFFFHIIMVIDHDSSYHIYYNVTGESMEPTITEEYVVITKENSFQEAKVGDIIEFKMRTDYDRSFGVQNHTDHPLVEGNYTVPAHTTIKNPPNDKDTGIEYIPKKSIIHRVISIREADESFDRALQTQGDNNPKPDPKDVMESGYLGEVVYIIPFGASFLTKLYTDRMIFLLALIATIMTYLSLFFIYRDKYKTKKSKFCNFYK